MRCQDAECVRLFMQQSDRNKLQTIDGNTTTGLFFSCFFFSRHLHSPADDQRISSQLQFSLWSILASFSSLFWIFSLPLWYLGSLLYVPLSVKAKSRKHLAGLKCRGSIYGSLLARVALTTVTPSNLLRPYSA